MLGVQVQYWNLKETERSNRVIETETNRHNVVTENETTRHNVATETETSRHNYRMEEISWFNALENQRHNIVVERYQGVGLEQQAWYYAQQAQIGWYNAQTSRMQAATQSRQVDYNYYLGRESNAIAYRNQINQERRTDIEYQRLEEERKRTKIQQYSSEQQVAQGWYSATQAARRVDIQSKELQLNASKYELSERQFGWQKTMDILNFTEKAAKDVGNVVTSLAVAGAK